MTKKISFLFRFFALCFVFLNAYATNPYQYKPADYKQFKNLSDKDVTILPEEFLREYDPLTVFFKKEMHPGGSGPLDEPEKIIKIEPSHPGEFRWLDSRTLEFRPTIPWPAMEKFKISVGGYRKELSTLLSPPVRIIPGNGETGLGEVEKITMEFEYYVNPSILSKLVTFESYLLPGIGKEGRKRYTYKDFNIKLAERTSDSDNYKYYFEMEHPFSLGLKVQTTLRLSDDSSLEEAFETYYFKTKEDFMLHGMGSRAHQFTVNPSGSHYEKDQALRLPQSGELIFTFSSPPAQLNLSMVKSMINFSPAPEAFDFRQSGEQLQINVTVETDKLYKVTIEPISFQDREGRSLQMEKASSFYFYRPSEQAFIRWGESFGIVERYGPQHFPISVSGIKNIDFRIYRIDPLNKAFWPFPETWVPVDENALPPGPGEEPISEEDILSPLSTTQIISHIQMLGSPHYSKIIDLEKEGVLRHNSIDLKDKLAEISGEGQPGTYLIGFRKLGGRQERQYVKIQVTDLCLSTIEAKHEVLFAVTSYKTGEPVAGANIKIEGVKKSHFETIYSGQTNEYGFLEIQHNSYTTAKFNKFAVKRVLVNKGDDYLVIDTRSQAAPPEFSDNHWSRHSSGWLQWLSYSPYDLSRDTVLKAHVFTERPIYRPEEKVYIKGYIRWRFQGELSHVKHRDFLLSIRSPEGVDREYDVELTKEGSFYHEFKEENLPTGTYRVNLIEKKHGSMASTDFDMESYRIPKFDVKLHGPDRVPNDKPFTMKLTATYYAGGKVVNQGVKWRVTSFPYTFHPKGIEGYFLSSDSRFGARGYSTQAGPLEEEQTTDENGEATLVVNPQSELDGNPRKYVCEATVTGADQLTVSSSRSVVALPSFILGLKTNRYVKSGNTIEAEIIALDVDEKLSAGHKVSVQLKRLAWHSYLKETDFTVGKPEYITTETVDLIEEREIETSREPVKVKFADQSSGVYILEINAKDKLGRLQSVKVDLFMAGDKPMAWQKPKQMIFETVPDKDSYEAGDVATIIIKSPYQNARALSVIEMPDDRPEYKWVDISGGKATLQVKILTQMVPLVPVSFLLIRPRIAPPKVLPEGQKVDLGKPETVANTTWLKVEPTSNRVYVDLEHEKVVLPGSEMDMEISLKDNKGNPLSGEVTLWLVDDAIFALKKEKNIDPLDNFIDPVKSRISVRDSRNLAIGDLRLGESPAGDGYYEEEEEFEGLGKITVRKTFKTVPYYNPRILVGSSGKTTVKIKMPDNLTNFAVRAVAVSGASRFGSQKSKVAVRLPVIVQPALPRFIRIGDKFKAGGIARVVEGKGGKAIYSIETKGVDILKGKEKGTTTLPSKEALPLYADMEVRAPGYDEKGDLLIDSVSFKIALQRSYDKAGDAFQVKIPLLLDREPVVTDTFGIVKSDSAFYWKTLTDNPRKNTLHRDLIVSDQLAILKVLSALSFLMHYPHGCIEQKVSYAYPALAYDDIWGQLGLESPDPHLKDYVNKTLEFLKKSQRQSGLFGYWPGSRGYVYLTAYVTEFLLTVKNANAGYNLDEEMINSALRVLKMSLRSDYSQFLSGYRYYERCAAINTLAMAGETDIGYMRELATQSNQVDLLSQSRIYKAILISNARLGRTTSNLEKELWKETVFKLKEGEEVFGGLQQRSMRIGAQVHASEIKNLSGLISAFSLSGKSPDKVEMMVNELVTLGSSDGWGNTNVNSNALLSLRDYMQEEKKKKLTAEFDLKDGNSKNRIKFDGRKGALQVALKSKEAGNVSLKSKSRDEEFYVEYTQSYLPEKLGSAVAAEQHGFVVKRELIYVSKTDAPDKKVMLEKAETVHTLKIGDIVEEHIQVVNPKDRHFVAVSAPFAAGFEPLNPNLETSSTDANPSGRTTDKVDYQQFLDDKVVYYFDYLPAGTYDFYFRLRATIEGEFTHPPAKAEMMYELSVNGNSPGARIVIKEEK